MSFTTWLFFSYIHALIQPDFKYCQRAVQM